MELIFDYMENDMLRHKLNALTQKTYGFDFEDWMAGGYFEGDYIPYSFMQDGKILANVSANRMHFIQNGVPKYYIQLGTVTTDEATVTCVIFPVKGNADLNYGGNNMLYLKEANMEDLEQEYEFVTSTPENETGFTNPEAGCTKDEFTHKILPGYIDAAKGIGLQEGWVPETEFFLWEDNIIVGWFRIRHWLTDELAKGAGHIGYGIKKEFRGKGYASIGLKLAVEKAWQMIREDEIYMSVHKDNPASLKVQMKNSAYIHHEDEREIYTRIKR